MNYELTPQGYKLLRALIGDLRMLLAEFRYSSSVPGFLTATVHESNIQDMDVRLRNMYSLPELVKETKTPWVAGSLSADLPPPTSPEVSDTNPEFEEKPVVTGQYDKVETTSGAYSFKKKK